MNMRGHRFLAQLAADQIKRLNTVGNLKIMRCRAIRE